jgi:hypothetical protein
VTNFYLLPFEILDMDLCTHVHSEDLKPPSPSQAVYREDCTQCFDSIDDELGLNVCLHCFNGGCTGDRDHARLHHDRFDHPLALNIKRTRKKVQVRPKRIQRLILGRLNNGRSAMSPPRRFPSLQLLPRRMKIATIRPQESSAIHAAKMI